jgi:predicted RNase H-like nuclease (RuvC/YqgF family)
MEVQVFNRVIDPSIKQLKEQIEQLQQENKELQEINNHLEKELIIYKEIYNDLKYVLEWNNEKLFIECDNKILESESE